ncbi:MAG: replicative DNA helicase [Bacteroidales bacterium]|nr:replicative DNA helicase [Bacteroidales bacterium]MCF8334204.1 replicative DNA helicase [Bacteroidales bacterium]
MDIVNNPQYNQQNKQSSVANKGKQQLPTLESGKIPPQALDIEKAVLGALMLDRNALTSVIDILQPEVFYKDAHQKIFEAIQSLFAKSEPIDILTVTNELKSNGNLDIIGGPYYITQLTQGVASAANIEYHARILLQKFIQRELIRISGEVIRDAYEDTTDVFNLMDKAEQELFNVSENNFRRSHANMQSLVKEAISEIEKAKESDSHIRGVPSGFNNLDQLTSGWQKADLVVLAARPGMGKTAFVLSMARNTAVDFQRPLAIFSLEMSAVQLVTRLISSEAQISGDRLRQGNLQDYEWDQLHTKIEGLLDAPIFIDDTPALSVFELRAKCRRLKEQKDIQMIIIDYIQLMSTGVENKNGNREQEISTISRSLKSLAKELNVPVIVLSQLNRSVETRGGTKRPQLSDLRESGAIEQDADMVLFIYRPEYYGMDEDENGYPTKGWAQLLVAKHRNGALRDINLRFLADYARFESPENVQEVQSQEQQGLQPNQEFDTNKKTLTFQSKMNDDADDNEDLKNIQDDTDDAPF